MSGEAARELVERSCREQGIALAVTDPAAIGRIADLLTQKRTPAPARGASVQEVDRDLLTTDRRPAA